MHHAFFPREDSGHGKFPRAKCIRKLWTSLVPYTATEGSCDYCFVGGMGLLAQIEAAKNQSVPTVQDFWFSWPYMEPKMVHNFRVDFARGNFPWPESSLGKNAWCIMIYLGFHKRPWGFVVFAFQEMLKKINIGAAVYGTRANRL